MYQLDYAPKKPRLAPLFLRACIPPFVAVAAWPILYFTWFLIGLLLAFFVILACAAWAQNQSHQIAAALAPIYPNLPVGKLRRRVLTFQGIGIIGSLPLFSFFLSLLQSLGFRVGWS